MKEKILVVLTFDHRQIQSLVAQLSPPVVYDSKCPLCGSEFILVPEDGFTMKPACGPQCAAQVLREAYKGSLEAKIP